MARGKGIILNGVLSPCKNCTERFVGCHEICEEYQKFKEKSNKVRDKRNMERIINNLKF